MIYINFERNDIFITLSSCLRTLCLLFYLDILLPSVTFYMFFFILVLFLVESACNAGSVSLEDPLEEGQPSPVFLPGEERLLAWAEEPGGLLSIGSQRVEHDWSHWAHIKTSLIILQIFFLWWTEYFPVPVSRTYCSHRRKKGLDFCIFIVFSHSIESSSSFIYFISCFVFAFDFLGIQLHPIDKQL